MSKNIISKVSSQIMNEIHNTPVLTSSFINDMLSAQVYFKCENFQRTGSFKARGATNAIKELIEKEKTIKSVITHSSGNFAQALAYASKQLDIKCYIVMPENAPQIKKDAVKGYGAELIECAASLKSRESTTTEIVTKTGASFIHPSNDIDVIHGQGTAAYELLKDYPDLDYIITPIGGGGLAAGTILAANEANSYTKVIACEPQAVNDAYRSLQSGKIETNKTTKTVADGLKTNLGNINFPIIFNGIEDIICVAEDSILKTQSMIMQRMKIVIEPSSAVAVAGLIKNKEDFKNKKIGVILSGGNLNINLHR